MVHLCFDDLDGSNTLKHCEKCSETTSYGHQTMLWTRVPFREYLRHTRATNFQTNKNLGLYSFFRGLRTLKQCDFNQKTSILDPWFTSYASKHPNFAGLVQKWDWPITSQETTF